MFKNQLSVVIIPAYRGYYFISGVMEIRQGYVDKAMVIDDCSMDKNIRKRPKICQTQQ